MTSFLDELGIGAAFCLWLYQVPNRFKVEAWRIGRVGRVPSTHILDGYVVGLHIIQPNLLVCGPHAH